MARVPSIAIPVRLVPARPERPHICSATIRVEVEVNGVQTGSIDSLVVRSGDTVTVRQPMVVGEPGVKPILRVG